MKISITTQADPEGALTLLRDQFPRGTIEVVHGDHEKYFCDVPEERVFVRRAMLRALELGADEITYEQAENTEEDPDQ